MKSGPTATYIDQGNRDDLAQVLTLVQELADYEKAGDQVTATLSDYEQAYDEGLFKCLVAREDEDLVGMMLFYDTWSTWKGKMMHLEDFVVKKSHRRRGIGELLMAKLLEVAKSGGYRLIKWQVLTWNEPAIRFYQKFDVVIDKQWWDVKFYLP